MWGRCAYLPLAGVFAVAALLAAGCGGDDSAPVVTVQGASGASGAGGAAALTKTDFIDQADAICQRGELRPSRPSTAAPSSNDAKLQATQELQITRTSSNSLQSLNPPDQERAPPWRATSRRSSDQVTALRASRTPSSRAATPPPPRPRRAAPAPAPRPPPRATASRTARSGGPAAPPPPARPPDQHAAHHDRPDAHDSRPPSRPPTTTPAPAPVAPPSAAAPAGGRRRHGRRDRGHRGRHRRHRRPACGR